MKRDLRRTSRWQLTTTAVLVVATTTVAACGSDDGSSEPSVASATTGAEESGLGEYCERAEAFLGTKLDASDVASFMASFERATTAARAVADVAPAQVKTAHERLASSAEELLAGLRAKAPQTIEDMRAANDELVAELTPKYGDLEKETNESQSFAADKCRLSFE